MLLRVLLVSPFMLLPSLVQAQGNRLLPVNDHAYEYIVRLQRRGHLLDLNPTSLPYRRGDVWDALSRLDTTALNSSEQHWTTLLRRKLQPVEKPETETTAGYVFMAAADIINSDLSLIHISEPTRPY